VKAKKNCSDRPHRVYISYPMSYIRSTAIHTIIWKHKIMEGMQLFQTFNKLLQCAAQNSYIQGKIYLWAPCSSRKKVALQNNVSHVPTILSLIDFVSFIKKLNEFVSMMTSHFSCIVIQTISLLHSLINELWLLSGAYLDDVPFCSYTSLISIVCESIILTILSLYTNED
jgi:hypothetical protein